MSILQKRFPSRKLEQSRASLWTLIVCFVLFSGMLSAQCPSYHAYIGSDDTGTQAYSERIGMTFSSALPFVVEGLSAFDSDQDGLNLPITVRMVRNSDGATVISDVVLSGTSDPLVGRYRVRTIAPVTLPAGIYTVVTEGYGVSEEIGNTNTGNLPVGSNDGGILTFIETRWGGTGPGIPPSYHTPFGFHAGNFVFFELQDPPVISCPSPSVVMNSDLDRCTAVVCFSVTATADCPRDLPVSLLGHTYMGSTPDGHTYFYSNASMSWEQANAAAVGLGGHLVSINSSTEQTFLSNIIPNGPSSHFWIGLRYSPSLNLYKWTTGEPVVYTNWALGEPNLFGINDYVFHWDANSGFVRGWHDGPSIFSRRYIVEFEQVSVNLIAGLPSGSNFPVGTTPVTYRVTDKAGNTSECSFNVIVNDRQAPAITCPSDLTVNLDPLECEGIANFPDATATDNCPGVVVTRTSPIASGSYFPLGVNVVTYQAEDASGNTSTCSFTVTVIEYQAPPLGCKPLQLSLDDDCEGELTPTMVLTGWEGPGGEVLLGCLDLYTINVVGPNGQNLGNTVSFEQLGKILNYSITHATNGFSCWNTVHVEDKIAPTIDCSDITVHCLQDLTSVGLPEVDDNCHANRVLINEVHRSLACDDDYIGTVTRTWKAVDAAGNESAPCTQTIYLERSDLSGISFPGDMKLGCNSGYATDNRGFGYPAPSVTGVPNNAGHPLYPMSQLNMVFCNSIIDYTDLLLIDTKCKKRIMRTWAITEWWCSTAVVYNMPPQFIDIVDEVAPVIPVVANITVTTQTRSCDVLVQLPKLNITDNCTAVYRVYINVVKDGNPAGFIDSNGGPITLGVGVNNITYTALDECGNTSTSAHQITVRDKTDPVAICDQFTTVSLKNNGYTEVTAKAIDDGSFDECGEVTLKVRRMEDPCGNGSDTAWYDKVGFCCMDADLLRMVQLLVTDAGGNTNICMVSVRVQDKVNPSITCPNDMTISDCLYTFDPANADAYFGKAEIIDNCPANNILTHNLVNNRNNCGIGTVVRTFSVSNAGITYGTCTQTITFINTDPFDGNDPAQLKWPKDYVANGQCSFAGLLPETLPDSSSVPIIVEDACDLVGMKYSDEVYPFTTNGSCYKIIRTWSVIDWCQKNTDGTHKLWVHQQEIKVRDTNRPVITSADTTKVVCTYDDKCLDGQITLTASATDCTPQAELKWRYFITKSGVNHSNGVGNNASGKYPIGVYNIRFTVEDKCGNISETSYGFEIRNCKAPTAICKKGLAASLVLMDVGNGPTPMTMLKPSFFDNKSSHICGYPVKLSFSSNVNDTISIYGCADLGRDTIQMWVTDINGNKSYCETYVDIQDSMHLCGPAPMARVAGKTMKENQEEIQSVTVEMKGGEMDAIATDNDGNYAFTSMHTGGDYQVIPTKDGDDINGISTLDIIMIQRHILGIEKLNSPYKLIAADINNSGKVTASDLTELRKLVLGVYEEFPDNTSWRFVDAGYVFPDVTNPWNGGFHEKYFINNLNGNMNVDFIGIKVGDINGNAKSKEVNNKPTETRTKSLYTIDDRQVQRGDIIEIPVMANDASTIFGLQAKLESKDLKFREIKEGQLNVRTEDYHIDARGNISISLSNSSGQNMKSGDVLFTLEVEAINTGLISQMIKLNSDITPEVYVNSNLETKSFGLDWRTNAGSSFTLLSNSPNPWNNQTSIYFEMPEQGMVSFKVRDYSGRKVVNRIDQFNAGKNTIQLDRDDLGQGGVYIYELRFGEKVVTGKMILVD